MSSLRLRITAFLIALAVASVVVAELWSSLIVAAIFAAIAIVLGVLLSQYLLKPLESIAAVASQITRGDFSARVRERPAGEVGELSDAFNLMAETIQQQMAAASQERRRLAAALNSSADAVIAVDVEGTALFANLAAERLFQRPADEIVGHPFVWTMPNDEIVEAIRASREHTESQASIIERHGRQFLRAVTTPIFGGGDWAVLVVFHDLTDVKRTEQVRRDFVANVSHELRTPLAGLKSVVETLAGGAMNDAKLAEDFLARADSEVDRLVEMVEELLELSRIESGEIPLNRALTDVEALIEDVVERLRPQAERKRLSLGLQVEGGLGSVTLDASRIEHALVNLIQNAIKFTPEGGAVTVSARRGDGALEIRVVDSGVGIAPEDLPRIWERFYKADQSRSSVGSGLGLAVVKHTVEAHGGSVQAESDHGRGSSFSFSIPLEGF